jgi:predicted ATPase
MAVVGENGSGKSTVLQCAAAVYRQHPEKGARGRFASDFFPDTAWDHIRNATITYSVREGDKPTTASIRKPGERWRGNPSRPERIVQYIDLSRILPVAARTGYAKLAKTKHHEITAESFDSTRLSRFSQIMGRTYELAKMSVTDADSHRKVPVLGHHGAQYSGFHQGCGETTIAELLQADLAQYSLVVIDEVETSLHPRAQRRLIRDLAARCRDKELQILLTTHSPYILDELPPNARAYIHHDESGRRIMYGVSPEFAMTKMDDIAQCECDLYVEDRRAGFLLVEILTANESDFVRRCQVIPYGASSVGQALGAMVSENRFPRPSCVFLDGDQGTARGCVNLPGGDAPERVVFGTLQQENWSKVAERIGRPYADLIDALAAAMALENHHEWVNFAATRLVLSGDVLWQMACAEWVRSCLKAEESEVIAGAVRDALSRPWPRAQSSTPPTIWLGNS